MKLSKEQTKKRIFHLAKVYFTLGKSNAKTIEQCGFNPKLNINTLCRYKRTDLWKNTINDIESQNKKDYSVINHEVNNQENIELNNKENIELNNKENIEEERIYFTGIAATTIKDSSEFFNEYLEKSKKKLDFEEMTAFNLLATIIEMSDILRQSIKTKKNGSDDIKNMHLEDEASKILQRCVASYDAINKSINQKVDNIYNLYDLQELFRKNKLIQSKNEL